MLEIQPRTTTSEYMYQKYVEKGHESPLRLTLEDFQRIIHTSEQQLEGRPFSASLEKGTLTTPHVVIPLETSLGESLTVVAQYKRREGKDSDEGRRLRFHYLSTAQLQGNDRTDTIEQGAWGRVVKAYKHSGKPQAAKIAVLKPHQSSVLSKDLATFSHMGFQPGLQKGPKCRHLATYPLVNKQGRPYASVEMFFSKLYQKENAYQQMESWCFREKFQVLKDIGKGLAILHKSGRVHGDLKLENILIDRKGRAVLGDMGSSYSLNESFSQIYTPTMVPIEALELYNHSSFASRVQGEYLCMGLMAYHLLTDGEKEPFGPMGTAAPLCRFLPLNLSQHQGLILLEEEIARELGRSAGRVARECLITLLSSCVPLLDKQKAFRKLCTLGQTRWQRLTKTLHLPLCV